MQTMRSRERYSVRKPLRPELRAAGDRQSPAGSEKRSDTPTSIAIRIEVFRVQTEGPIGGSVVKFPIEDVVLGIVAGIH